MKGFPLYSLVVEGATIVMTMDEAIALYNQARPVEIDVKVVDKDGSIRQITDQEDHMIRWGRTE